MVEARIVLVADDSQDDFLLLKAAFQRAGLPHRLIHVADGDHAIMYLEGVSPYSDRNRFPFPDLLTLDVRMPDGNGFEVLSALRRKPEFQVPVVMFSASNIVKDVQMAADLGAIHFFTKPGSLHSTVLLAQAIHERWLVMPSKKRTIGPRSARRTRPAQLHDPSHFQRRKRS